MNHFWGRRLLTREIEAMDCEEGNLPNYKKIAAVERLGNRILCHRCGNEKNISTLEQKEKEQTRFP